MGNGSAHESCLKHAKIQADIDKVCRETGECADDRKEIWNEVNNKPSTKLMCWIIGIIVSIFVAFMSTGFYFLSSQISVDAITLKEVADRVSTVKTDTEILKVQSRNLNSNFEKHERSKHNSK